MKIFSKGFREMTKEIFVNGKTTMGVAWLMLVIGLIFGMAMVSADTTIPKIVPYVNDYANTMSAEQQTNLNIMADAIEKNTTYEIAIVTVPTTNGQDLVEYANRIGDENGVGKVGLSNGIVILWSLDNIKGGAIATGRGSETIFNDVKVGRIARDAKDFFYNGSYYDGFTIILNELNQQIETANQNQTETPSSPMPLLSGIKFSWWWVLGFGILWLVIIIWQLFSDSDDSDYSESRKRKRSRYLPIVVPPISSDDSSSSGSFRSGFGGGFGGGSFGGGGVRF